MIYRKVIIILVFITIFPSCKKKYDKHKPTIINISIHKSNVFMAPAVDLSNDFIKKQIINSLTLSDFNLNLNETSSKFKKPYEISFAWSIRPVQVIRTKIIKKKKVNRITEVEGEIILRPLFKSTHKTIKLSNAKTIYFSTNYTKNLDLLIKSAVLDVVNSLTTSLWLENKLMKADMKFVMKYLKSSQKSYRKLAVNIVGKRKLQKAGKYLSYMLTKEEDVSFVMRIAGVLGILKEKSAVKPLSELALKTPVEHTIALMHIIAKIGGKDAEIFLHWMENSHNNKDVKKAARKLIENFPSNSIKP